MFFVISGFIMVYITGAGPFSATTFLKRRAVRIVPTYWLFTSIAAVLAAITPSLFQTTIFTWSHYLQSLFFIVHEAPGRGGTSPILSLGWTLNYEVFFYVIFSIFAFLSAFSRVMTVTVAFVALWLAGLFFAPTNPVFQFYLNASPLAFAIGAWMGWYYLRGGFASAARHTWLFAIVASAGAGITFVDNGTPLLSQVSFAGQALWGASLLYLGLALEPKIKRWRLLEQLGDASYALYLSHIFVIGAVVYIAKQTIGYQNSVIVIFISIVSIISACVASLVIFNVIEKPIIHIFSRKIIIKEKYSTTAPSTV